MRNVQLATYRIYRASKSYSNKCTVLFVTLMRYKVHSETYSVQEELHHSLYTEEKLKASKLNEEGEEMEDDEETVEDDDDITTDAMIKVNTKPKKAAVTSKAAISKTATKRAAKDDSEPASKPASKKKKT